MGTIMLLPGDYSQKLRTKGIRCHVFNRFVPVLSGHLNNRNHRKIGIIDGKVAFTGGINLADEYINEKERFGHWKDNAVMITGEAVRSFTIMFLQIWNIQNTDKEDYEKYLTEISVVNEDAYVMPYGDQPFDKENVGEYVYMDIINKAKKYVYITTPYLIPDNEMLTCLEQASKRGVDIKIMMPHITDKPSAYLIARTYYPKLIERGIEIYEYTPGFVHAKTFISDDKKAVVGTVNMDFRSLYLNLECGAYMENVAAVKDIYADYMNTLEKCTQITLKDCNDYNPVLKLFGKLLWIIAPLM
jgi:cardiolipin synthase